MVSMREDGFYKAARGITSLEEVLRVVYHNESDVETARTANEVVTLSEGGYDVVEIDPRTIAPKTLPGKPPDSSRPSCSKSNQIGK
jgi:hypothetical protein